MKKSIILSIIIVLLSFTGCSKYETEVDVNKIIKPSDSSTSEELDKNEENDIFDMTVWTSSIDSLYIEKAFKDMYPKAKLKIVKYDVGDSEEVIKALAADEGFDLILYHAEEFGNFNAIDGFEDLLQSKYNIENIKPLFSQRELKQCMSFDDKKLIALPYPEFPMVTYYRADILQQHGLPSDPDELGDFMGTQEGWLTIANELKKDGIYAIQWKEELLQKALKAYGFFDEDMNLIFNNEKVKETLSLTLKTNDLGLMSNYDIWTEEGRKAIVNGKIAMIYINKWGEGYLKSFAPETAGKWRATRLPLNIYGYLDSSYASIAASSKYKMQAWGLARKLLVNDRDYIDSVRDQKSEFLGGQKSKLLYEELTNKLPIRNPTMLDDKVYSIFFDTLYNNINTSEMEDILNLAKSKINQSTYHEQRALAKYIKENR